MVAIRPKRVTLLGEVSTTADHGVDVSKVVSFRLNLAEKERLERVARATGKPLGETVRAILDPDKLPALIQAAENRGEARGVATCEAVWLGKAYKPCSICGQEVIVDFVQNPAAKKLFRRAFTRWAHVECIDRKRNR
jgi:hypothetical protein